MVFGNGGRDEVRADMQDVEDYSEGVVNKTEDAEYTKRLNKAIQLLMESDIWTDEKKLENIAQSSLKSIID
jgi:hypothetical protein